MEGAEAAFAAERREVPGRGVSRQRWEQQESMRYNREAYQRMLSGRACMRSGCAEVALGLRLVAIYSASAWYASEVIRPLCAGIIEVLCSVSLQRCFSFCSN